MSAFYEQLRAEAGQLLADLGRPITFQRSTFEVDLVSGTSFPTVSAEQTLNAAVVPASSGTLEAFDVRFMPGIADALHLRFAIVSALGATFMPGPNDRAIFDGHTWEVLGCTPLDVDGTPVTYNVGFRRV